MLLKQIAADFGISESCLRNWMHAADVEDGHRPGTTSSESVELRDANRRIRLLEQENEVLRRAAALPPTTLDRSPSRPVDNRRNRREP